MEEFCSMREACMKSSSEVSEITAHVLASRSRLSTVEEQVNDWKEACSLIVNKGRGKEDKYAVAVNFMRAEMVVLS